MYISEDLVLPERVSVANSGADKQINKKKKGGMGVESSFSNQDTNVQQTPSKRDQSRSEPCFKRKNFIVPTVGIPYSYNLEKKK